MRPIAVVILAALTPWMAASPLRAEIVPLPGSVDPHIQSVRYDPQDVVALHLASGFATTIQFGDDERIETVSVGDSTAWAVQVNRRADHLVVKPLGMPVTTNLTVVTDQRTYNFTLYDSGEAEVAPYVLSFTYPPPPVATSSVSALAVRYRLHGDRAIWPMAISDDGRQTTISWGADIALPAVYRSDEHRQKALVNLVMKDGAYVIEGVHDHLVFIRGRSQARADRMADHTRP